MGASPPRPRGRLLTALLLYAAVGGVAQWELLRAGLGSAVYRQEMLGQDCLLHAWTIAWDQHAIATAPCRIADANIFHPERGTLLYSDHLVGLALVSAPLRLVTDNPLLVHNVVAMVAPVLDALALFALAHDLTGRMAAALVAGLVFGFAPLRLAADACQIQMTAAWWLPLILLGALRAVRGDGRRWGVVAGVALVGQGLTGVYLTAFFLPFLALAHAVWLRRYPWRESRGGWPVLLAAELAAACLLAPTALAYRGVQTHLGTGRSPFLNAILSLQPELLDDFVPTIGLGVLVLAVLVRSHDLPRRFRAERSLFLGILAGALLLALGPAVPLPGGGTVAGPYRLLLDLPGFTALRAPGRMLHVALLAASVLAAGGVTVLREIVWRAPGFATLVLVAGLAWEGRPPRLDTQVVPRPEQVHAVYPWLATEPETTRIVELPVDPYAGLTSVRQYASAAHWRPSLNGNTGIQPPVHAYMVKRLDRFPDASVVAELSELGVTHAIVHRPFLTPEVGDAIARAAAARRLLKARWSRDGVDVYVLRPHRSRPARPRAGTAVDRTAWRATASTAPDLAHLAVDADPATAWRSWAELDASVQRGWYHPDRILDRWRAFLGRAPATLTIDLGPPTSVARVEVRLGGSDPMTLQEVTLEGSADGATWLPLPLAPFPNVRALVDDAASLPVATTTRAREPLRRLRLRTGALETHVRDVAVFAD